MMDRVTEESAGEAVYHVRDGLRMIPRSLFARAGALAVAATLWAASDVGAQDVGLKVGAKAPAVTVETLDGAKVDLASYFGKTPVVIEFWATWCSNCKDLEPAMRAAKARYGDRVRFVGVAVGVNQSTERVRRYADKYKVPFDVFYDRRGDAVEAYGVPATSYVIVVDAKGTIVYTGLGGDQDVDAAIKRAL
jgi:peroxiredoxin